MLERADAVAAEDTRHSGMLLAHHGIEAKLVRIDAHTAASRGPALLDEHDVVAYVSDAGTPGISDPGAELVRLALSAGHQVEALPGATAFVPALVLSGLPLARFSYEGFLPRKGSSRTRRLDALARRTHPTALYESPRRLVATLRDMATHCGEDRRASVSRELTKRFEETVRGTLREVREHFEERPARGEIVVVIGPAPERPVGEAADADGMAVALAGAGVRGRTLRAALEALGVARNDAYRLALEHGSSDDDGPAPEESA